MVQQVSFNERNSPEYVLRLESEYDNLLLENDKLIRRLSRFINVYQDIHGIAKEYTSEPKAKHLPSNKMYGVEIIDSSDSLDQIPIAQSYLKVAENIFGPPNIFK